jgi:RNA polymerase sigma-70 factor, ECF subfamily
MPAPALEGFVAAAGLAGGDDHLAVAVDAAVARALAREPALADHLAELAAVLGRGVAAQLQRSADDAGRDAEGAARSASAAGAAAALAALVVDDLALATAARLAVPAALARFDAELADVCAGALARMGASADARREVAQQLRERLLVGDGGGTGRLATYLGRGPLRVWLRAAAVRTYLNSVRGAGRETGDAELVERLADPGADPELAHLRDTYRGEFQRAFTAALAGLGERQRTLLRMAYLDGLRLEELAALYQTSRATAHRWLVRARTELAAAVEGGLRTTLGLSETEFHSVRRLVQSQLEVSLRRVLG